MQVGVHVDCRRPLIRQERTEEGFSCGRGSQASLPPALRVWFYPRMAVAEGAATEVLYALSADLVHWSSHRLLVEASMPWCAVDPSSPGLLETVNVMYPSIVDHADTTINFEKAGRTPHLYYVRFNEDNLDRDVVRVPLTLTRTN